MATVVEKWTHEGLQWAIDFGYTCRHVGLELLKPEQLDAICLLLEGKSVFVTLPTGYGISNNGISNENTHLQVQPPNYMQVL